MGAADTLNTAPAFVPTIRRLEDLEAVISACLDAEDSASGDVIPCLRRARHAAERELGRLLEPA